MLCHFIIYVYITPLLRSSARQTSSYRSLGLNLACVSSSVGKLAPAMRRRDGYGLVQKTNTDITAKIVSYSSFFPPSCFLCLYHHLNGQCHRKVAKSELWTDGRQLACVVKQKGANKYTLFICCSWDAISKKRSSSRMDWKNVKPVRGPFIGPKTIIKFKLFL